MAKENKMSSMMTHYLSVKEKYNDCIVFYRLGDFYEMFFDDALEASKLLDLTLTGRDCGLQERAPMCGIPFHAADMYIAKLVSMGKKVAICEQLTEPGAQKGLVERDVVKVVTGGTVTEDNLVDEKSNNFICCVYIGENYALSWADITTGEFYCQQVSSKDKLLDALYRVNPSEIICNEAAYDYYKTLADGVKSTIVKFSPYKEQSFSLSSAKKCLLEQFSVATLDGFIPSDKNCAVMASGALVCYLRETQMHSLCNIKNLSYYDDGNVLILDASAQRNLEVLKSMRDGKVYGSLLWAIDFTKTAGGARKLKEILTSPLHDIDAINYRLDGVDDLYKDNLIRESLSDSLKSIKDLERLSGRISNNILNPRDARAIADTLSLIPIVKFQLSGMPSKILKDISTNLGDYEELSSLIDSMIVDANIPPYTKDGGFIKDGFDERLDHYRAVKNNGQDILKEMEQREREATGIKNLKIGYNKVFGFYIEVTKSFVDMVPYTYIRKQTLVGAERYITEELKKFEEDILSSTENIIKIENEIFGNLKKVLIEKIPAFLRTAKCLSMLDVLVSFATVSKKRGYVRPEILAADKKLNIVGGRHPVVEATSKENFVPNDTLLDNDETRMAIITGPNMAGKSTYMRQVALIVLLAHAGCYVPAKSAEIPLVDKIFTRVGASDNLIFDQSTFMVEMAEVANIIRNATKESLLILDEIGRGTSTYDGLSIAWAVVEYISSEIKAKTLFATHYHELSELENKLDGVKNFKISVKEINGKIIFLRKITQGSASKSFGVEVASIAGVPESVTARAKKILKMLEKNDLTQNFNDEGAAVEQKQSFVEKYLKELDINNLTPLKAFEILSYLKEKVDG